jgi:hypothetical protein
MNMRAYLAVHSAESFPAVLAVLFALDCIRRTARDYHAAKNINKSLNMVLPLRYCLHDDTQNGLAEEVEGWSEASSWSAATVAEWASRRSEAEGLDRSATLGAEKRQAGLVALASEYIGLVVSARSAKPNESRQAHAAGTKL